MKGVRVPMRLKEELPKISTPEIYQLLSTGTGSAFNKLNGSKINNCPEALRQDEFGSRLIFLKLGPY